jgi:DNA-binding NarL/FixJ family response regulator
MESKLRVAIVDDHPLVRESIGELIKRKLPVEISFYASNGKEFLYEIQHHETDLVILDINMPIMNGILTLKEIKKRHEDLKVIMLTMHEDQQLILKLINYKVNGFVLKSASTSELINAIKTVQKKGFYFSQEMSLSMYKKESLALDIDGSKDHFFVPDEIDVKILSLICEEKTSLEIADEVNLSDRTVDNRKRKMMKKIGAQNQVGLAIYAIKSGVIKLK